MTLTLYMACSANGYIADQNGLEEFLPSSDLYQAYIDLINQSDCLIYGRKTYEVIKSWGEEYFKYLRQKPTIIISTNPNYILEPGIFLANSPEDALKTAQEHKFEKLFLSGGASTNSSFAKAGLIDKIILSYDSVIIGQGKPIFDPANFKLNLKLVESKVIFSQVVQLHYEVLK